jgi:tripartite-type tricarboxylate transporter receptor subunit TctC
MAEDAFLLWVHADRTDIKTLDDFVKAARAAGDRWIMAGTGIGQEDSLLTDFLNSTYGFKMTYKAFGGGGEVARELAEKRADPRSTTRPSRTSFSQRDRRSPLQRSRRSAWRCICASLPSGRPAWISNTSCSARWWELPA